MAVPASQKGHRDRSDSVGRELQRISGSLFTKKAPWDQLCQEICENYYPMRADYTTDLNLGDDFSLDLMDSYPIHARQQLGDAIPAMLRQDNWFAVSSGDEELDKQPAVARGLERMTQVVRSIMRNPRSKAVTNLKPGDHDWVTVGVEVASWEESMDRSHPILKSHHPRDNAWMENDDGVIDTNYRKVRKTAREIVRLHQQKGWAEPHPEIKRAAEIEPERLFNILHCLCPTDVPYGDDPAMKRQMGTPFVSIYFDADHGMTLRIKPAPWFNYRISRWWRLGDCPWGFSPVAINTLPDGRMTQALTGMVLEQGEKSLDPPMVLAGEIFRNDINLMSAGVTLADLTDGRNLQDVMTVIDTAKNMPVGFEMKQDLRAMIAEGFLLNKLMLPQPGVEMTVPEVMSRLDEFRRAALPFFEPIGAERHANILDGALQMAFQMRWLTADDIPDELSDRDSQWSFTSPLNEAEGQKVSASFRQVVADVASILEIDPTAKTRVIWGQALQDALMGDGAKPKWLPTDEELEALTDQSKQMNDASVAAQALQQGASVAADVSSAQQMLGNAGLLPSPGV